MTTTYTKLLDEIEADRKTHEDAIKKINRRDAQRRYRARKRQEKADREYQRAGLPEWASE